MHRSSARYATESFGLFRHVVSSKLHSPIADLARVGGEAISLHRPGAKLIWTDPPSGEHQKSRRARGCAAAAVDLATSSEIAGAAAKTPRALSPSADQRLNLAAPSPLSFI
ncbi:hypothetical protein MRX96_008247 [Rhipicephalus microplus]